MKISLFLISLVKFVFIFSINSCAKENNDYQPMVASNIGTTTYISIDDDNGNSLLSDKKFIEKISIYGEESRRNISFSTNELNNKIFIRFEAELPDWRNMSPNITENTSVSFGSSKMRLNLEKQLLNFNITSRYQNSHPEIKNMIGGTGIHVQSAEINGKVIEKQGDYLIIPLLYSNGKLILKE